MGRSGKRLAGNWIRDGPEKRGNPKHGHSEGDAPKRSEERGVEGPPRTGPVTDLQQL